MEPEIDVYKKYQGFSIVKDKEEPDGSWWVDGWYYGVLGIVRIYSYQGKGRKGEGYSTLTTIVNGYDYSRQYKKAFTEKGLQMKAAQLLKDIYNEQTK